MGEKVNSVMSFHRNRFTNKFRNHKEKILKLPLKVCGRGHRDGVKGEEWQPFCRHRFGELVYLAQEKEISRQLLGWGVCHEVCRATWD